MPRITRRTRTRKPGQLSRSLSSPQLRALANKLSAQGNMPSLRGMIWLMKVASASPEARKRLFNKINELKNKREEAERRKKEKEKRGRRELQRVKLQRRRELQRVDAGITDVRKKLKKVKRGVKSYTNKYFELVKNKAKQADLAPPKQTEIEMKKAVVWNALVEYQKQEKELLGRLEELMEKKRSILEELKKIKKRFKKTGFV